MSSLTLSVQHSLSPPLFPFPLNLARIALFEIQSYFVHVQSTGVFVYGRVSQTVVRGPVGVREALTGDLREIIVFL